MVQGCDDSFCIGCFVCITAMQEVTHSAIGYVYTTFHTFVTFYSLCIFTVENSNVRFVLYEYIMCVLYGM